MAACIVKSGAQVSYMQLGLYVKPPKDEGCTTVCIMNLRCIVFRPEPFEEMHKGR
jgi:hypothetical protein